MLSISTLLNLKKAIGTTFVKLKAAVVSILMVVCVGYLNAQQTRQQLLNDDHSQSIASANSGPIFTANPNTQDDLATFTTLDSQMILDPSTQVVFGEISNFSQAPFAVKSVHIHLNSHIQGVAGVPTDVPLTVEFFVSNDGGSTFQSVLAVTLTNTSPDVSFNTTLSQGQDWLVLALGSIPAASAGCDYYCGWDVGVAFSPYTM